VSDEAAEQSAEIEDDPVEMIRHLIAGEISGDTREAWLQQTRDALAKFVDARIAAAFAARVAVADGR
jgi:hypothetical protein